MLSCTTYYAGTQGLGLYMRLRLLPGARLREHRQDKEGARDIGQVTHKVGQEGSPVTAPQLLEAFAAKEGAGSSARLLLILLDEPDQALSEQNPDLDPEPFLAPHLLFLDDPLWRHHHPLADANL